MSEFDRDHAHEECVFQLHFVRSRIDDRESRFQRAMHYRDVRHRRRIELVYGNPAVGDSVSHAVTFLRD